MLMNSVVRADSIDLRDRDAPTAQSLTPNQIAPHQAETLREVAAETADENSRSPRTSWVENDADDLQKYADELASGITDSLHDGYTGAGPSTMQTGPQQDALAIAQNGGLSGQEVDDSELDGETEVDMDDDMMDKISSSPSIEDEDIDFEFVYALHTFVATVEGQANATKGDTMVLLDDSNSYWWLVRVVKDSSIGYLPAEHIETPTERLARLNKHRNIDLSASMLGDQAEKPRNPFASALKRKKAKTVQFAGNTYVDYSDIDYSSEEEDAEGEYATQQQQQQQQQTQGAATGSEADDETAKVEPLKPRGQKDVKADSKKQEAAGDSGPATAVKGVLRSSEEIFDTRSGDGPKKTGDGTVRDSFFKDDTVETKKITLTPNLLRDEVPGRSSNDSGSLKQRPSLDKLDKDSVFSKDEKKKKEKKEKEKKPSAIRSFFSRKDKKGKGEDDEDSLGKRSIDVDSQEREPDDEEPQSSPEKGSGVQRNPSKLQKPQPRTEPSPTRKPGGASQRDNGMDLVTFLSEGKPGQGADQRAATMRAVDSGPRDSPDGGPRSARDQSPTASRKGSSRTPNAEPRPQPTIKAKSRMELDEFDTDDELDVVPTRQAPAQADSVNNSEEESSGAQEVPAATQTAAQTIKIVPPSAAPTQQQVQRLSESPVHVSPVTTSNPPPLMVDTSSQEEDRSSPISSPSPELIDHNDGDSHENKDSITTSSSTATTSWNDVNLRAFFDSGSEIRDLLVVVYDKTDVEPAGPDHPVAGNLFREQHSKLAEITSQLDNMLGDWLARKQRLRGGV